MIINVLKCSYCTYWKSRSQTYLACNLISPNLTGRPKTASQSLSSWDKNAQCYFKFLYLRWRILRKKAGLVVNWISCHCTMTLYLMGTTLDKPETVFETLENIFRPESNQTLRVDSNSGKLSKPEPILWCMHICQSSDLTLLNASILILCKMNC